MAPKEKKPVKARFQKKDGTPGPGRLFARKGESPADAKKRLSKDYKIPKGTPFDKGTNSFVPKGRDPAFKPKASKEAPAEEAGDSDAPEVADATKKKKGGD